MNTFKWNGLWWPFVYSWYVGIAGVQAFRQSFYDKSVSVCDIQENLLEISREFNHHHVISLSTPKLTLLIENLSLINTLTSSYKTFQIHENQSYSDRTTTRRRYYYGCAFSNVWRWVFTQSFFIFCPLYALWESITFLSDVAEADGTS